MTKEPPKTRLAAGLTVVDLGKVDVAAHNADVGRRDAESASVLANPGVEGEMKEIRKRIGAVNALYALEGPVRELLQELERRIGDLFAR